MNNVLLFVHRKEGKWDTGEHWKYSFHIALYLKVLNLTQGFMVLGILSKLSVPQFSH